MRRLSVLLVTALSACSVAAPVPAPEPPVEVRLTSRSGPISPQYAWEYTVSVRDTAASIEWRWVQPRSVRTGEFAVPRDRLAALRATLEAEGATTKKWARNPSPRIGGGSSSASGSVGGAAFTIPPMVVTGQAAAAGRIFAAVDALVPDSVRRQVRAR